MLHLISLTPAQVEAIAAWAFHGYLAADILLDTREILDPRYPEHVWVVDVAQGDERISFRQDGSECLS